MRKNRRHDDDNDPADRWLVSYADFITLLFAFFVVMYALSLQGGHYQDLSQSVEQALGQKKAGAKSSATQTQQAPTAQPVADQSPAAQAAKAVTAAASPGQADPDPAPDSAEMREIAEQLSRRLSLMLQQGASRVRRTNQGIYVEIEAGILFAPGGANLNSGAMQALRSVADVLRSNPDNVVQVVGHTDNIDIHSAQYPSNWELSAARASSVVRLFIEAGIDGKRLIAIGHGATRPVAENSSAEGRLRNRRVEIQILPLTTTI